MRGCRVGLLPIGSYRNRNSHGFTIVEILVATGLLTIVLLGSSSALRWINGSVAILNNKTDALNQRLLLGQMLSTQATCQRALGGQNASGKVTVQSGSPGASPFLEQKSYSEMVVKNLEMINLTQISGDEHIGALRMTYQTKGTLGDVNRDYWLRLRVSNGLIKDCWSEADIPDICTEIGGTYDPSQTPSCRINQVFAKQCPVGQIATGFDNSGQLICVDTPKFTAQDCGVGQIVISSSTNGLICGAPPPVQTPPADSYDGKRGTCTAFISPCTVVGMAGNRFDVTVPIYVGMGKYLQTYLVRQVHQGTDSGWVTPPERSTWNAQYRVSTDSNGTTTCEYRNPQGTGRSCTMSLQ